MASELRPPTRRHKLLVLAISAGLALSVTTANAGSAPRAEAAEAAGVGQVSENAPAVSENAQAAFAPKAQAAQAAAESGCTPDPGYTNCSVVTYSGTDQTFTVPSSITSLK